LAILVQEAASQVCPEARIAIIGTQALLEEAGVTAPPGLMIDGRLILQGTVPTLSEMKALLREKSHPKRP